jgi:hypothetical protein
MLLNSTGEYNTAIGHMALYNNNANGNTVIGYRAGYECTSGFGNVMIGYQAGLDETGSYKLYIESSSSGSPLIWGDFSDNRIVINGNSSHNPNNRTFFSNGSAGGTTTWYTDSDIRKKKNIHTISSSLEKVLHLRGVNFEWIDTESHCNGPQMGFVAQEVISVVPEVVDKNGDSYTMQYAPLTALLVEAIKEQQEVIESLKREIEVLKNSDDRE